jgi:small conductance mechanosensitive channel
MKVDFAQNLKELVLRHAPNFVVSLIIVIIAYYLATWYRNTIIKKYKNEQKSLIYYNIANLLYYLIFIIGIFIAICNLGFEVSSLITIFATLGIATALALQGILTNVASGFTIAYTDLYNLHDIVEINGIIGTVSDFDLLRTTINEKGTNIPVVIPNNTIQSSIIKNFTKEDTRISVIALSVSNNNMISFDKIFEGIKDCLQENVYVLDKKNINTIITDIGSSGTNLAIITKIKSSEMLTSENNIRIFIRKRLQEMGVLLLDNAYSVNSAAIPTLMNSKESIPNEKLIKTTNIKQKIEEPVFEEMNSDIENFYYLR